MNNKFIPCGHLVTNLYISSFCDIGSFKHLYFLLYPVTLLKFFTKSNVFFFFLAHLFCLCWVLAVSGLSLVAAAMPRLLLAVASLVLEHRL